MRYHRSYIMVNDKDSAIIPEEVIKDKIYLLRGQKVMLDKDLAVLYGVKATRLREQVKRNADRFPDRFMFQLTKEEVDLMVSQNAIPSKQHLGGSLPYAFTEHGVLMLANVLKSSRAIQMSVRIIDVFVKLRELLLTPKDILLKLEQFERQMVQNSDDIQMIFNVLKELLNPLQEPRKQIGYKRKEEL
jgi:hypothetical protein